MIVFERDWQQVALLRGDSGRCPNCNQVPSAINWHCDWDHIDGDGGFVCDHMPPTDNELWAHDLPASRCDHRYGLVTVHGSLFSYVRCWFCDLRERVGFRWEFTTIGAGIDEYKRRHPGTRAA